MASRRRRFSLKNLPEFVPARDALCVVLCLAICPAPFGGLVADPPPGQATTTVVTLQNPSPGEGQPLATIISVTGSGFPAGPILPENVTVSFRPFTSVPGVVTTTKATSVVTNSAGLTTVTFTIPASIVVSSPTPYAVNIGGVTSSGAAFSSTGFARILTVDPPAQVASLTPSSGQPGQSLSVTITGAYTTFVQGVTEASFGLGVSVGGGLAGMLGPVTVTSPTSATAQLVIEDGAQAGKHPVEVQTGAQQESLPIGFFVARPSGPSPYITGYSPLSASVGTVITISGTGFEQAYGVPVVTMTRQGGGTIAAPVASYTDTAISFVVPAGAASGTFGVTDGPSSVSFPGSLGNLSLSIVPPSTFALAVSPSAATLIQGQSTAYAVTLSSSNGFNQLATLSVSGLPTGVTATFAPPAITAGQTSILTVAAPTGQAVGRPIPLTISASATIAGQSFSQTANPTLQVTGVTTSFLGRTVVDDAPETPIAGVTVKFLGQDPSGNTTGCSGQTVSDGAGNFSLTNLPASCTGPQLISYDGSTATSPQGQYAGVNLSYTLTSAQVTTSPVLIHLPRIDNAETVQVQQNASADQTFTFATIPSLVVTVYAGTTFTLGNGSQPSPFPLTAIKVPVDRLPDVMPASGNVMPFIVAFQPANATASQPVAVTFPNTLNTAPGVDMTLTTLDPTRGVMVPYGTGMVSIDGNSIIPDPDPANAGHSYGLVHFDWHGPAIPPPPPANPAPDGPCEDSCCSPPPPDPGGDGGGGGSGGGPEAGDPVDLSSGLQVVRATDIAILGERQPVFIRRVYRTMNTTLGPFGIGTNHNYGYSLNTKNAGAFLTLVMPDGNQYQFTELPGTGTYTNVTIPSLAGAVITSPSSGTYNLRWKNGTIYQFQSPGGAVSPAAFLSSITDRNGNTITLVVTVVPGLAQQFLVTQVIDTVGRALTLSYDSSNRITKITDPIGRTVQYSYNSLGMLATMTDPAGGLTSYGYTNPQNSLSLTQITDPRNVVVMQDTYDANGRVIQQVQADGGIIKFSYTLLNPGLPSPNTSPVLQTVVTDPLGNQTTYRFDPNQFLSAVTDASGQTTIFTLNPSQNSLVSARTGAASCPKCGNPSGGDLSFTYDANGNVLTRTDSLGNATTYTYDPVFNQVTSITDPLLHVYRYTYDSNGNMLSATDPNGNVTSYTYNSFGQLIQTVDALGGKTVRTYDSFGNEATATNALGNTLTYVYDAVSRFIQGVDPLGRTTTLTYDALGRVLSRKDPLGHSIAATYDPIGDVLSMTDESGNEASFTFDAMGRLVSKTDPRGKTDTRTYDLNSNLITFVDRSGQTSTFGYDTLNRLTEERYQDRSTVSRSDTVSRSYDARGRPTSVVDSVGGVFGFAYYADGRPASSSSQFGTTQYARDATGRVTSLEVAGQSAVAYAYDAAGNLLSASQPQASATLAYDARNRLTGITRPNGVSSQYGYDAMRDLLSLTHSGGQGVDLPLTYSYDAVNNRSAYTTNFAQPQAVANSLDPSNRLTASGATSYTYDDNGSMTSSTDSTGATTYTWDSRDRLASISAPGGQKTTFLYDFLGNLIQQADAGPTLNLTQNFVLDDLTNAAVISRSNGDSVMVLAGRSVDQDLAVIHANGQVEYGLSDAINSTQATVDQSGKLVSSFSYEPFGKTTTSSTYPFQFTGRVPVTAGLYYYRARYYCPSAGRFISEDPLGLAGGDTLLYKYGRNNPVNRTDPSGLLSSCAKCGIISVLGAAAGCGLLAASVGLSTGGVGLAALGTGGAGLAGLVCGAISTAIFIALCDSTCNPPPAPPPSCAPQ